MKIKVKKLDEKAVTPSRGHADDAGLDITATSVSVQGDLIIYGTSLAIAVPKGHVGLIACRSSIYKYDLELTNSLGILDSGYNGEVKFIFRKTKQHDPVIYKVGDRIGQLIVTQCLSGDVELVDDLGSSERGSGGWGSTDAKVDKQKAKKELKTDSEASGVLAVEKIQEVADKVVEESGKIEAEIVEQIEMLNKAISEGRKDIKEDKVKTTEEVKENLKKKSKKKKGK